MRLLFIATGYLPYTFSENLCNGKLVYALEQAGIQVDVISRVDEGPAYSAEWKEPWMVLKERCHEVSYPVGNKVVRGWDTLRSALKMQVKPQGGIRWARRAFELAEKMLATHTYDAVLTRSPSDIPHLVGLRLKQKYNIRWIANWNDPAAPIWPKPYTHAFSPKEQKEVEAFTWECLAHADINTFPSQWLLDHFASHFPNLLKKKNDVLPHIALHPSIAPVEVPPLALDKFRMCHSGNLSAERNPELLFQAMRQLIDAGYTNMELHIMGHINTYTQTLIKKYALQTQVQCIGGFPYMEALQKMQQYDCLVLLEAVLEKGIFFPSKFTDYAQLHRPILAVSPADGFAATMLKNYGGGLSVNNEEVEDIKKGVLSLYQLWEKGELQQHFDTQKLYHQFSADTVVKLYNEMLCS